MKNEERIVETHNVPFIATCMELDFLGLPNTSNHWKIPKDIRFRDDVELVNCNDKKSHLYPSDQYSSCLAPTANELIKHIKSIENYSYIFQEIELEEGMEYNSSYLAGIFIQLKRL